MNLNEWSKEIHSVAVAHGWWEKEPSFGEIVALCHSELSEALEEHRNCRPMQYVVCGFTENDPCTKDCSHPNCTHALNGICIINANGDKPEGIAVEMADCLIRILDWCGYEGIDIEAIVALKNEYNKTRPYRHGGKVL